MPGIYVPGKGNPRAKLMVVGEAPGFHEEQQGEPFVGPSGSIVNSMLREAGLDRSEVYVTNVVKVRPPDNDLKALNRIGHTIEEFLPQLELEIRSINPNCILALGALSFTTLTGLKGITLKEARGSIYRTKDGSTKVVPTFHPANLIEREDRKGPINYSARLYIQLDFNKAVEESQSDNCRLPERNIIIAKDSLDVYRYLQANEKEEMVSIDIETLKCIPSCIGLAFTPNFAISLPLTVERTAAHPEGMTITELVNSWRMIDGILKNPKIKKIGQNFKFDQSKLELIGFSIKGFYADTMLMMHTLYPELPKSLEFMTSIFTREPFYKNEGRDYDPKKHRPEQFYVYNAKDAAVTMEVFRALDEELKETGLSEFYYGFVHKLHDLYLELEREGLLVDNGVRKELRLDYNNRRIQLQDRLDELVGHAINVNSPKQVFKLLFDELRLPKRKDTGEDTLVALLNNVVKDEKRKEIIRGILRLRRVKKTISTYLNAEPDFDGRMRTTYKICGTETGRTATEILDPPVRSKKSGIAFQTMTKHGDVGNELRSIFVADPGFYFVEVDLSQAEARIVALLSEDVELLDMFQKGIDVHKVTASVIFYNDRTSTDKITKDMRFIGKESRHAGNYDVGKRRFMQMVNSDAKKFNIDVEISEYRAGKILDSFHSMHPNVRDVFHKKVVEALENNNLTLVNPFGRTRQFLGRWDENLFKEGYAQIPQSTVADQTKLAMLRVKERLPDTRIVLEAHDAFVALVPRGEEKDRVRIFVEELERPIDFEKCTIGSGSIVIPAEAKLGSNYKDLGDFKLS